VFRALPERIHSESSPGRIIRHNCTQTGVYQVQIDMLQENS
jgi:hypothetical protein